MVERQKLSLNIKNEETCQLAREVAGLTGVSITSAVTLALREKLDRLRQQRVGLAAELLRIGQECAAHLDEKTLMLDHGEFLYDEMGLPK